MEYAGYKCSKDSVFRYIKQLNNELDADIITSTLGKSAKYFIGKRYLEKEEIQIIVDATNAANVIKRNKAKKLVEKHPRQNI